MPGVSPAKTPTQTIETVLGALRAPCFWKECALQTSASIGIAFFPDHGDRPEELLRQADRRMYDAKKSGKNRAIYVVAVQN